MLFRLQIGELFSCAKIDVHPRAISRRRWLATRAV
jgi:hypothetical protein